MVYAVENENFNKMCDAHRAPPAACKNTSGGPDSTLRVKFNAAPDAEEAALEGLDFYQARAYWTDSEPPCRHNDWDNQRVKHNRTMLKCRKCDKRWPTSIRKRCARFLRGACTLGDDCTLLHIHKYKNRQKETQRRLYCETRTAAKKHLSPSESEFPPCHPYATVCAESPAAQYTARSDDWDDQSATLTTKPPAVQQGLEGCPLPSHPPAPARGRTPLPLALLQNSSPLLPPPSVECAAYNVRVPFSAPYRALTQDSSSACARRRAKSLTPFILNA